jgi:electron transfer flavoprotein beta subunit
MMKILVCIKQIACVYAQTGLDPDQHFLSTEDRVIRVNPCDEVAAEMAIRMKEANDAVDVSLLTIGPLIAEDELRRCMAFGADHLYQVLSDGDGDPRDKSGLLAAAVRLLGIDLVLCGRESSDRRSGQVAAYAAHELGWPYISAVTELDITTQNDRRFAWRNCGRGAWERVSFSLPALLSVEVGKTEPRIPIYDKRLLAESAEIMKLNFEKSPREALVRKKRTFPPRPRPGKLNPPDSRSDAYRRTEELLKGSRMEKQGQILAGSPESQLDGMIAFLKERGFL